MTIQYYQVDTEKEIATAKTAINLLSNFKDSGVIKTDNGRTFLYVITEA